MKVGFLLSDEHDRKIVLQTLKELLEERFSEMLLY